MQELEIGMRKYRTGKLDAFKQFHLVRKLLPLFSGLGETTATLSPSGDASFWNSLGPVAQAISDMSVEDSEWIIKTCLSMCSTFNGRTWVPVMTPQGDFMFEDMDLQAMLQLAFAVIQDNLGAFFPAPQTNGLGGEASTEALPSLS
jgi:hypothetical protein